MQWPGLEDDLVHKVSRKGCAILPWCELELEIPKRIRGDNSQEHQGKPSSDAVPRAWMDTISHIPGIIQSGDDIA